jgi:hypothetical protein
MSLIAGARMSGPTDARPRTSGQGTAWRMTHLPIEV